jgi:hypothetical protein
MEKDNSTISVVPLNMGSWLTMTGIELNVIWGMLNEKLIILERLKRSTSLANTSE